MKYNIIYADPPWKYTSKSVPPSKEVVNHYSTMDVTDISRLPVRDIAADDSFLFMWATFPCLPEALEIFCHWGFAYKTIAFCWVKTNPSQALNQLSFVPEMPNLFWGMGAYTRANPEICLLGKRGKPEVKDHSVHSVIIAPIQEHSRKPDITRDRIVQLCGDLPRVELFARNTAPGWDIWGNEVVSTIDWTQANNALATDRKGRAGKSVFNF